MKKNSIMYGIIVALALTANLTFGATDSGWTVGTNSVMIVPRKPLAQNSTDWVQSTAYSQGDTVKSGLNYYFATTAGTTGTTAPTHTTDTAVDGTVTWLHIDAFKRSLLVITMDTAGGVSYLGFDGDAEVGEGTKLVGAGHMLIFSPTDDFQGAVWAISDGATNTLTVVEM